MSPCQTFIDILRSQGFRITHQREVIIEAIAHSGNHVNAEAVYRTLELLVEQGLASRIDLGEGKVIYATYQHGPHIHLVCRQCGQVIDADQNLLLTLNKRLNKGYQFAADLQHISVLGLCNDCQMKQVTSRKV
jgi:Fur family ferric uptake transcriptional regulator